MAQTSSSLNDRTRANDCYVEHPELGQGIHGARKRCEIRSFIRRALPRTEVLILQEHCYSLEDCFELTQQIQFRGGKSYWNNALYNATGDRFHAGTGILVSSNFSNFIVDSGVAVEGRAQYVILEINRQKIGILNVYVPNEPGPRGRFWEALLNFNLPAADWLLSGDFNMTEVEEDRSDGFHARNIGRREATTWSRLLVRLGVQDCFYCDEYRRLGNKRHTWRRERPQPTWSRLDRFYAPASITA